MLFVFDGFDEFPAEVHMKSLITDIISGSVYLPKATVLATSRPSATAQLQSLFQTSIGTHVEIVGCRHQLQSTTNNSYSATEDHCRF